MSKAKLIALVGAPTAAWLLAITPQLEGKVLRGHRDPIGIVTACSGHTKTAVLGRPYTEAECEKLLVDDLIEHAEPVLACTPGLKGRPWQLGAAVSFAINVGAGAYCGSATAARFNAGNFRGACRAINESDSGRPQWVTAGGKVLPGLVKRRAIERSVCERGLP